MKVINGQIISGTPICVDYWLWTPEGKYNHFLTHLHADHTVNLKSTFRGTIYTSPFNSWLLRSWFNINPDQITALTVGDSHLIYNEESQTRFSVTPLDANHCPGSVMFLFQGHFGNILYTGDFRYDPKILDHPMLKSLIENEAVDRLYLDNTFAAEHCEFPSRQEALQIIISFIKNHPDHNILLGVRRLGKEEVLRSIALELKEKVCVSEEKLRILTKLGYENVFTTHSKDSRIIVQQIPYINQRFISQIRSEKGPVKAILLTALYSVMPPGAKQSSMSTDIANGIHKIPYSDHSSHSELVEFVSKIKPKEIFPIVSSSLRKEVSSSQNDDLSEILTCAWQNSVIPKSILKLCRNVKPLFEEVCIPENIQDNINGFTNYIVDSVISYPKTVKLPKDGSKITQETSSKFLLLSDEKQGKSELQVLVSKGETKTVNEYPELILRRNRSPAVCSLKSNQDFRPTQSIMNSSSETALANQLAIEEYFTLSDEELSPNYAVQGQHVSNEPNSPSEDVSEASDKVVCRAQHGFEDNDDSERYNTCSSLNNHDLPLSNETDIGKQVSFTTSTPPSVKTCDIVKKTSLGPMSKHLTIEEQYKEHESSGSTDPDVGGEVISDESPIIMDENYMNNVDPNVKTYLSYLSTSTLENREVNKDLKNFSCSTPAYKTKNGCIKHFTKQNTEENHADKEEEDTCCNIINYCKKVNKIQGPKNEDKNPYMGAVINKTHLVVTPSKQFKDKTELNIKDSQSENHFGKNIKVTDSLLEEKKSKAYMKQPKSIAKENILIEDQDIEENNKTHTDFVQDNDGLLKEIDENKKENQKISRGKFVSKESTNFNQNHSKHCLQNSYYAPKAVKQVKNVCDDYEKIRNLNLKSTFHSELYSSYPVEPVQTNNHDKIHKIDKIRDQILRSVFFSKQLTACQNVKQTTSTHSSSSTKNSMVITDSSSVPKYDIASSKMKIEKQTNKCMESQRNNDFAKQNIHSKYVLNKREVNLPNSNSFNPHTLASSMKRKQINQEDKSQDDESDRTISDLEDNCVTVEMFEKLDKNSDQISRARQNYTSTPILEKFNHLLVQGALNKSSDSGFFPPVHKRIKSLTNNKSVLQAENNEFLQISSNNGKSTKDSTKDETTAPNKRREGLQQTSERLAKGNNHKVTLNSVKNKRHGQNYNSQEKSDPFFDNLNLIYKSWKKGVNELKRRQTQ